jgi:hypothetical protein
MNNQQMPSTRIVTRTNVSVPFILRDTFKHHAWYKIKFVYLDESEKFERNLINLSFVNPLVSEMRILVGKIT